MAWSGYQNYAITALVFQVVLLALYAGVVRYDFGATQDAKMTAEVDHVYPLLMDVSCMIFLGFGLLMTAFTKYAFSAVGFNFMLSCFAIQWSTLTLDFWKQIIKNVPWHNIGVTTKHMVDSFFLAGSLMITFGAMLGKATPTQYLWMSVIHIFVCSLNFHVGQTHFSAVDMGGSNFVHLFGAIFGVGCAWGYARLNKDAHPDSINEKVEKKEIDTSPTPTNEIFAMIGTIVLFIFWSSFNGALATQAQQHRVIINTIMALCACCFTTFAASAILRPKHKFSMIDIQNATIAGGVAVGSSADLTIEPWGAILVGMVAAFVSVGGYVYLIPAFEKFLGLHDTCGVFMLHGLPGIIGCTGGAVSAGLSAGLEYGKSIGFIYPEMGTSNGTLASLQGLDSPGSDRTADYQAGIQMGTMLITICIGLTAGIITGLFIGSPLFAQPVKMFDDTKYWEVHGTEHEESDDEEEQAADAEEQELKKQDSKNAEQEAEAPAAVKADDGKNEPANE